MVVGFYAQFFAAAWPSCWEGGKKGGMFNIQSRSMAELKKIEEGGKGHNSSS